jgi:hypothetical protein
VCRNTNAPPISSTHTQNIDTTRRLMSALYSISLADSAGGWAGSLRIRLRSSALHSARANR